MNLLTLLEHLTKCKLGTISGGWFKGESFDTKGDYLAISRESKRVDVAQRKDGLFASGSQLRDYSPKVYPEDVSVGKEVCYHDQNENKWAFVRLVSDDQLALAKGTGNCPTNFPQDQSEIWER